MRTYGIYREIRNVAWDCLIKNGIDRFPVDVLSIARAEKNIRVIRNSSASVLKSGEYARSYYDGEIWYIVYDDSRPVELSRYAIAHELGHYFLDHKHKYLLYFDKSRAASESRAISETQADLFAQRILCPSCILWGIGATSPSRIAKVCKVTDEVARKRAQRMAVLIKRNRFLTSEAERTLFANFSPFIEAERKVTTEAHSTDV